MKSRRSLAGGIAVGLILVLAAGLTWAQGPQPPGDTGIQAALGTAFTYQGQLKKDGNPVSGTCDFQFSLWDAASGGSQIGTAQSKTGVQVSDGYFTIPDLDFGAGAFQGDARWLQIAVKCAGDASYTTLTPRQPLTAAPYALYARSAWSLTGNSGTTPGTNFLGTTDNQALEFKVYGQRILRLEPSNNLVGGSSYNSVSAGTVGATIGGGGSNTSPNSVTGNYGTIGGGHTNTVSGFVATVGGGRGNTAGSQDVTIGGGAANNASGQAATIAGGNQNTANGYVATVSGGGNNKALSEGAAVGGGMNNTVVGGNSVIGGGAYNTISATVAVIGGGHSNLITGTANYATIAGGYNITVTGQYAAVGGGSKNIASGDYATIPGGNQNAAVGNYSFAAGQRARANHTGAFVWADSTDADFSSTANNQFAVRATGGVTFTTGSAGFQINGNTVWHAGNDGPGSGLDADTLDGLHASTFVSATLLGSSSGFEGSQQQLFSMSTTGWAVLTSNIVTHTLVITTTNVRVEYTLWYGGTVVHGEASQGSPATITFPHYRGFQLILARHQYIASLVCNENDTIVACVYQKSHP